MFAHQHRFSVLPLSNDFLRPQDHNRLGQFSADYCANSRASLTNWYLFLQLNLMGLPSTCTYHTSLFLWFQTSSSFIFHYLFVLCFSTIEYYPRDVFDIITIIFVSIIVSMVPSVVFTYRITDSETSQARQPQQLFVLCFLQCLL